MDKADRKRLRRPSLKANKVPKMIDVMLLNLVSSTSIYSECDYLVLKCLPKIRPRVNENVVLSMEPLICQYSPQRTKKDIH